MTPSQASDRYRRVLLRTSEEDFARDVRESLSASNKSLPCKYFYDDAGMKLFEQICQVPEYYLTRVESQILATHAAEIIALSPPDLTFVELGPGTSSKTKYLIGECLRRQSHLSYYAIDISPTALETGARELVQDWSGLDVVGLVGEFTDGLNYLAERPGSGRLVVFLGSTIGNFADRELSAFLTMMRRTLRPTDRFLLGVDLIKDPAVLEAAYDDAQQVTARFNLNILARINRELGGDFDLSAFRHRAVFNRDAGRIEMHLVSQRDQQVTIRAIDLEVNFRAGETIHTENCYKHSSPGMTARLAEHGLESIRLFSDAAMQFGLFLVK